ncbi:signal-transducing adaptor protein 2-like [Scleropages formosus]|uniref:Signal-transducing adaptor protein 2-like n=1 Tax=Scleropages formosus TaxID=113540 RepID=A0A0P7TDF4_SCLFO|nr:signal-transducing adaptor protein 2-like [Scleropages formosus]
MWSPSCSTSTIYLHPARFHLAPLHVPVSQRLWTCLCGNALFFFNSTKDAAYAEKLELSGFVSLTDDDTRDKNLEAARLTLRLEARELWKGFIRSVVERHPDCGNLLLRPGRDGSSLAVTTRQDLHGHYRVTQKQDGGYLIEVENPRLVEKTAGTLQPFLLEQPYERNITSPLTAELHSFFNGLRVVVSSEEPPALPPKPGRRGFQRRNNSSPSPARHGSLSAISEELKLKLETRRGSQH